MAGKVQPGSHIKKIMKTKEQKRGEILAKRLQVLNDFLISESDETFGEFLSKKGISVKQFLAELPEDYQFNEIGEQTLTNEEAKEDLQDYAEDLHATYIEQYLGHLDNVDSKIM